MTSWRVIEADCVEAMAAMAEASVDAVMCDPPYHLAFMGRAWDRAPSPAESQAQHRRWADECLRVLKPGGHLLAFGGTRTYHRLACAIEDAGFEIRDTICWLYGSGFPKSLDVSKAIDKAAGAEREVVQTVERPGFAKGRGHGRNEDGSPIYRGVNGGHEGTVEHHVTAPATPDAERWQGWGTALKPAHEPIVVARKPLVGTVAGNVLAHGTGALNVDATRVGPTSPGASRSTSGDSNACTCREPGDARGSRNGSTSHPGTSTGPLAPHGRPQPSGCACAQPWTGLPDSPAGCPACRRCGDAPSRLDADDAREAAPRRGDVPVPLDHQPALSDTPTSRSMPCPHCTATDVEGRWPANVVLDEQAAAMLDEQTGEMPPSARIARRDYEAGMYGPERQEGDSMGHSDSGGASRFFYCAKSSSAERNAGLDGFAAMGRTTGSKRCAACGRQKVNMPGSECQCSEPREWVAVEDHSPRANGHPTVKPIALMRWLVRLVTPPGGLVLDPFTGSGTTGCAAMLEGFDFIGIEREDEYAAIARARIAWWAEHPEGVELVDRLDAERSRRAVADAGQLQMFGRVSTLDQAHPEAQVESETL